MCSEESNRNDNSEDKGMVAKMHCPMDSNADFSVAQFVAWVVRPPQTDHNSFHSSSEINGTKVYVWNHIFWCKKNCTGILGFLLYPMFFCNTLSFNLAPPWDRHLCSDWNVLAKIEWTAIKFATYFRTVVYELANRQFPSALSLPLIVLISNY